MADWEELVQTSERPSLAVFEFSDSQIESIVDESYRGHGSEHLTRCYAGHRPSVTYSSPFQAHQGHDWPFDLAFNYSARSSSTVCRPPGCQALGRLWCNSSSSWIRGAFALEPQRATTP
jgi:hypothetical protein